MGDVATHFNVTSFVRDQLMKELPSNTLEPRDYTYLELGNFLTDMSQFRDPVAYHKARKAVSNEIEKKNSGILAQAYLSLHLKHWASEVFGSNESKKRHGALAEFFEHVICAFTHMAMADDGIASWDSDIANNVFPNLVPLSPGEIDRVFKQAFTQYWPHEHLDFPPVDNLKNHQKKRIFRSSKRKILKYLEWDIQFLSEEFSKLELKLLGTLQSRVPVQERHDLLVQLGNLLHPIEDFFFHSNFVDVRQWQYVKRRSRHLDAQTSDGRHQLAKMGLTGTGLEEDSVLLRRLLYRRLRYPDYIDKTTPSDKTSQAAADFIYTGGFGEADIFHTIGSALEKFEQGLEAIGQKATFANHPIILFRLLSSQRARKEMLDKNDLERHVETHKKQLTGDQIHQEIRRLRKDGKLSKRAEEQLLKAFDLDKFVENRWEPLPGIGGLLIAILGKLEEERQKSERGQRKLNRSEESIINEASDNSVSAEVIGSHSLMSKDSSDKDPLRHDAEVMARHASASLALLLMKRVISNKNPMVGLDWDVLIRFYLKFPGSARRYATVPWDEELRLNLRLSSSDKEFLQPNVTSLKSQSNFSLLGPQLQPKKLKARRDGHTRQELERYYRAFED